ncbi:MAG: T9SS type A sorting domain-containing protein [Chitinophagales bacterium]
MKHLRSIFTITTLLGLFMHGFAQTLPSNRSVDWTLAGLNDTSTAGFEIIALENAGLIGDSITPNDSVMDSLLNLSYSPGVIFQFPEGNFLFNQSIQLQSNKIIKGAGPDTTQLIFDQGGNGHSIRIQGSATNIISDFSAAAAKGDQEITLTDASAFTAGDWIHISQNDSDWVTSSWAEGTVGQVVKIESVQNNTLTLASPLRMDYDILRNPRVKKLNMVRNVGIECLKILRLDNTAPQQSSNIIFSYAENCWVNGIESENCTFSHMESNYSSNLTLSKSYFHHGFEYGGGGRAYGLVWHFTSNECLAEDNIFEHLRHSILLQAGANGNVAAFNYSFDPYWEIGNPPVGGDYAGELVLHGNYVYANLFEQNICQNIVIDNSHGANGPYNTFLRNRANKYGIFFSDNTSPRQNFLGNEVTNENTPYSLVNYNLQGTDHFIYGNNNKGSIDPPGTDSLADISYAYTSRPDFVSSDQWGKIGPPNAINSSDIPARIRNNSGALFSTTCGNAPPPDEDTVSVRTIDDPEFILYPNPAKDQIHIQAPDEYSESPFRVFELTGKTVLSGKLHVSLTSLDLSGLSPGLYFVNIAAEENYTFKVVKK